MKHLFPFVLITVLFFQCRPGPPKPESTTTFSGKPMVPVSIMKEHTDLLSQIDQFAGFTDSTGRAALRLKELMEHHFREEEDYVLPPLGILNQLAGGVLPDQEDSIIQLTEKLRSQSGHMLVEHQTIKAYLGELKEAARKENHEGVPELEMKILSHAQLEEEILFPTALLIGDYLKLKSRTAPN